MLATALQRLIDDRLTTPKQLAQLAGVAPSTVYRWLERQGEPDFSHLLALLSGLPEPRARETILLALMGSSGFTPMPRDQPLDVNRDGVVDQHDALTAVCAAIGDATDSLQAIHRTSRDRALTEAELQQALALLQGAIRHCATTQAVLVDIAGRRKEAKR